MARLWAFARGIAVAATISIWLILVAVFFPDYGRYLTIVFGLLGALTWIKPFPSLWIENKATSAAIVIGCLMAFSTANHTTKAREDAIRLETLAENERRLKLLKTSDPKAYLEEIKATAPKQWESEFASLDKAGYDKFVAERDARRKVEVKATVNKLQARLKTLTATDVVAQYQVYAELSELEPDNNEFKKRRSALFEQKFKLEEQLRNPKNFVEIENFTWSKEGFGNVMVANFLIKNGLPWPVKDIEVRCQHSAPSGTSIDYNTRVIYERIEANKTRRISNFNMGFIHNQAQRSGCVIRDLVVLR